MYRLTGEKSVADNPTSRLWLKIGRVHIRISTPGESITSGRTCGESFY